MDKVVHFEIPTGNKASSKAFYSSVFGWQLTDFPLQGNDGVYTSINTVATDPKTMMPTEPGAINGGLKDRSENVKNPVITIEVSSIDDYLKKIADAGGKVVEDKKSIEGMGHYAYFADPEGNVIGLWETSPRQ